MVNSSSVLLDSITLYAIVVVVFFVSFLVRKTLPSDIQTNHSLILPSFHLRISAENQCKVQ